MINKKLKGWIAFYNGKQLKIDFSNADDLYSAKQYAVKHLKVSKNNQGLIALEPAY